MKKIVSLIIVGTLFSTATFAQIKRNKPSKSASDTTATAAASPSPVMVDEVTPQASRKEKRAMMKELNLSKTQMKQLKEMRSASKTQKEAIDGNTQLSDEDRKVKLQEFRKEQMKKLQQILTPEQIQKLKEMRKQKAVDKMEMGDLEIE